MPSNSSIPNLLIFDPHIATLTQIRSYLPSMRPEKVSLTKQCKEFSNNIRKTFIENLHNELSAEKKEELSQKINLIEANYNQSILEIENTPKFEEKLEQLKAFHTDTLTKIKELAEEILTQLKDSHKENLYNLETQKKLKATQEEYKKLQIATQKMFEENLFLIKQGIFTEYSRIYYILKNKNEFAKAKGTTVIRTNNFACYRNIDEAKFQNPFTKSRYTLKKDPSSGVIIIEFGSYLDILKNLSKAFDDIIDNIRLQGAPIIIGNFTFNNEKTNMDKILLFCERCMLKGFHPNNIQITIQGKSYTVDQLFVEHQVKYTQIKEEQKKLLSQNGLNLDPDFKAPLQSVPPIPVQPQAEPQVAEQQRLQM